MKLQMAVIGATGLVGREMVATLAARRLPVARLRLLASARSAGCTLPWNGTVLEVEDADTADLRGLQVALLSAGAAVARRLAPRLAAQGTVIIDNSSAFRTDPAVPLVVPEVNQAALAAHRGLIANPNCSTIQLVVALAPLRAAAGLRRVTVATYQSVSGQGWKGIAALAAETRQWLGGDAGDAAARPGDAVFPHPIAGEALAHCGEFDAEGWSTEELKLMHESRRILGQPGLAISVTAVRVPVERAHSEAVWVETESALGVEAARACLRAAPGVELVDEPAAGRYPRARAAAGGDAVLVGRLRRDPAVAHGLLFWVVADNVRKGAALNAVQILEALLARGLLQVPDGGRNS